MSNEYENITAEQEKILNEYIKHLKLNKKSFAGRRSEIKQFMRYVNDNDITMFYLSLSDAESYQYYIVTLKDEKGNLKYRSGTVLKKFVFIKSFYRYLLKEGKVLKNPFENLKSGIKRRTLPRNIPTEEKLDKLLKELRKFKQGNLYQKKRRYKTHVMAELMYSTGARINEILKINPREIDFASGSVKVKDSKTGKSRICFLNSYCTQILKIYLNNFRKYYLQKCSLENKELLFCSYVNSRITCNDVLNKTAAKLKLGRFTSHNLRHSVGYHFLRAGCDIRYIQEILGHSNLSTTQIYTKVDKHDLKNVLDKFHPRKFKKVKQNEKHSDSN